MASDFTWLGLIPGITHHNMPNVTAGILGGLAVFGAWRVQARLKSQGEAALLPDDHLTGRNILEMVTEGILGLARNIIGHNAERYLPLLGTLFFFILIMNLIGLVPGFHPPTTNLNVNLAMALVVFLYYNFEGFREHGFGYLKQFAGPVIFLAPLMFAIEVVGHVFRPISLTLRLFGNMNGDHMVVGIFSDLVPVLIPVIFLMLGVLVCLIQAFVFTVLTAVYIGLAVSHDH